MKKIKYLIICLLLLVFPTMVKAETSIEMIDKVPHYQKDGKDYLDINAVKPNNMPSKYCEVMYSGNKEACESDFLFHYIRLILTQKNIENIFLFQGYHFKLNGDKIIISYCPEGNSVSPDCASKEFYVDWKQSNKKEVKEISDIINKQEYMVYGDAILNLAYNNDNFEFYSYKDENFEKGNYNAILSMYPEFKEIIEEYVDYEFVLTTGPSGGDGLQFNGGSMVGIFKDGALVDIEYADFIVNNVLFVPEQKNQNLIKSAEKLLKESYKKNKEFTIEKCDWLEEYIKTYPDKYIDRVLIDKYINVDDNRKLNTEGVTIKIGNSSVDMLLVGVTKEEYKEILIKSKDKHTGVNIIGKGYDIPSDVRVIVKDLSDNDDIKKAGKDKNIDIKKAYDIDLKRLYDNSLIKETPFGVEVYIPVEDYKENDKVKIYYVKDNKIEDEQIDGIVIKKDNKLYIKFIAKHFSTYAVGDEIKTEPQTETQTETNVPKTLDNIQIFVILASVSIVGLLGIKTYKRNLIRPKR